MHDGPSADAPHRPRSTARMLALLVLFGGGGLLLFGLCLSAYVNSTPDRTLRVPLRDLQTDIPRFYPLPSFGAALGNTHGVWVVLSPNRTALALFSQDPHTGCVVPWRAEQRFEEHVGVFRDPCGGWTYTREGVAIFGPPTRGLDRFDAVVGATEVRIDLERVRLGPCRFPGTDADCSGQGLPRYRDKPPTPSAGDQFTGGR